MIVGMAQATPFDDPGHAALRRGRRSIPGQAYLLTTATASRRAWFANWPVAVAVARELGTSRLWRSHHVHAWVLMPDHLHVLVTLGNAETLPQMMGRVKAVTARSALAVVRSAAPLWAGAFHDHALRSDEQLAVAVRYIIANPVRAGLVASPGSWPFWDSEWLPEPGM
ncbi:MAG TPA: transposase [Rhodanobacteraceae bacterium]|nr:transposase [Rhodanobacteraceae bacterium]